MFDESYFSAWRFIPMLLVSALFSSLSRFLETAFRSTKKTGQLAYSTIAGGIINIVLNYFLLKHIGTIGAAFATAFSFMLVWLIRMISIRKIVDIKVDIARSIINYALIYLLAVLTCAEIKMINVASMLIIVCIFAVNLKDLTEYYKVFTSKIKSLLNSRKKDKM